MTRVRAGVLLAHDGAEDLLAGRVLGLDGSRVRDVETRLVDCVGWCSGFAGIVGGKVTRYDPDPSPGEGAAAFRSGKLVEWSSHDDVIEARELRINEICERQPRAIVHRRRPCVELPRDPRPRSECAKLVESERPRQKPLLVVLDEPGQRPEIVSAPHAEALDQPCHPLVVSVEDVRSVRLVDDALELLDPRVAADDCGGFEDLDVQPAVCKRASRGRAGPSRAHNRHPS